jgi:hypothetical protein
MNASLIEHLVQARGIESQYLDAFGHEQVVSTDVIKQILVAMGYPVNDQDALINTVNQETERAWFTIVEPASIVRQGLDNVLHFKLPIDFANDELDLTISKDNQICKKIKFVPIDQELLGYFDVRDMEIQHYALPVELDLPIGYYQLALCEPGIEESLGSGTLIITPESCYKHPTLEQSNNEETKTLTLADANSEQISLNKALLKKELLKKTQLDKDLLNKDLYCTDVTFGQAPDDSANTVTEHTTKQSPMNPAELYQRGYQPIIELFRSNMSANNILKINDVLSLLRQWWVPKASEVNREIKNVDNSAGAYVYYPFDDLLAILALESQLNQTAIICGDLARMPAEMAEQLQQMAIEA